MLSLSHLLIQLFQYNDTDALLCLNFIFLGGGGHAPHSLSCFRLLSSIAWVTISVWVRPCISGSVFQSLALIPICDSNTNFSYLVRKYKFFMSKIGLKALKVCECSGASAPGPLQWLCSGHAVTLRVFQNHA